MEKRRKIMLPAAVILFAATASALGAGKSCKPTEPDEIGPFYKPNAPVRSSIDRGYILSGTVRSAADCRPLAGARIEVWQVGPDGNYDDAHRATLFSGADGKYRLETNFPTPYLSRPPHIHILVLADGFQRLITQHYPRRKARGAAFDLVLLPGRTPGL